MDRLSWSSFVLGHPIDDLHLQNHLKWAIIEGDLSLITTLLDRGRPVNVVNSDGSTLLHCAAQGGHVEVIRELVDRGCDLNAVNNNGCSPLHDAASNGRKEAVLELINLGSNMSLVAGPRGTPLHQAVLNNHLETVVAMIEAGCPIDAVNSNGFTLLHFAARGGHVEVIRELVDRGCDLNAVKNNGCSPLHDAASNGRKEAVLELIHLGSNMSLVAGPRGTPLHQAVLCGHLETVVVMIDEGCAIDTVDSDGSTLLHFAARGGHVEVIRELVDRGCDVSAVEKNGGSPLHFAAARGRKEAVLELIHLGSNMSLVAGPRGTPLHQAVLCGHLETVVAMIDEGCPIDAVNSDGSTLLHFAARGGHVEVIRELVDRSCDLNAVKNNGCSSLHAAASNGKREAVLELIHIGSNMSLVAGPRGTPLHQAVLNGHLETVVVMIDEGCPIDAVDSDGSTLLHFAARGGHVEVIRELVDRGCDLNAVKNNGCSPLHDAARKGRKEAVLELIHLGSNMSLVAGPRGTPLHQAVLNGHLETVVDMIEEGCPLNVVDSNGETLLHYAAAGAHLEIIRELIRRGCSIVGSHTLESIKSDNEANSGSRSLELTPLETAITSGEGCHLDPMCTTMRLFDETESMDKTDLLMPLCERGFVNQNRLLCLAAIPGDSQFFDNYISFSEQFVRANHHIDMKLFKKYFLDYIPDAFPHEGVISLNPLCIALFTLHYYLSGNKGGWYINKKSMNHILFIKKLLSHPILKGIVNDVLSNGLRPLDLARQFGLGDIVKSLEKAGGQPGLWSMLPREIVTSHSSSVSKSFSGLLSIAQSGPMGLQAVIDMCKRIYCHSTDSSGSLSVEPDSYVKLDLADISKHVVPVVATKCYQVGVYLGIEGTTVDIVERDYADKGCEEICLRMFDRWLRVGPGTGDKERTWRTVLVAVKEVAGVAVCEEIEQQLYHQVGMYLSIAMMYGYYICYSCLHKCCQGLSKFSFIICAVQYFCNSYCRVYQKKLLPLADNSTMDVPHKASVMDCSGKENQWLKGPVILVITPADHNLYMCVISHTCAYTMRHGKHDPS